MKYVLVFIFLLTQILSAESRQPASFLKGVRSFTVYSQISPHAVDLSFESALEKTLSSRGAVIDVKSKKTVEKDFYEAMSNSVFLKLSLDNWIVESGNAENKTFKVEVHLVLECLNQSAETETVDHSVVSRWISEEVFDFSSDRQVLLDRGQRAVKNLATQFLEAYRQANPQEKTQLTFFVL